MNPQIRIIDNRKISLTQNEWDMYQTIARSYDRANFKGEELFKNLFESDDNGIILFLKPPNDKYVSMEVFLFVSAIMLHQHIRQMHSTAVGIYGQLNQKAAEFDQKIAELDKKIAKLEQKK